MYNREETRYCIQITSLNGVIHFLNTEESSLEYFIHVIEDSKFVNEYTIVNLSTFDMLKSDDIPFQVFKLRTPMKNVVKDE